MPAKKNEIPSPLLNERPVSDETVDLETLIVTFIVPVAVTESVAVIVAVYVPGVTLFATLRIAVLSVAVFIVIPAELGDTDKVRVLFPVPPEAVIVSTPVNPLTTLSVVTVAVSVTASLIV